MVSKKSSEREREGGKRREIWKDLDQAWKDLLTRVT